MLKKFFLNFLSSFMGAWVALVLFGVVAFLVIAALIAKVGINSSNSNTNVSKGSVMVINLNGYIEEREVPQEPDYIDLVINNGMPKVQTLTMLKRAIAAAAENKNISARYLNCGGVSAAPATLHSLRQSLEEFKKSGKPIISYAGSYSMGDYYIATVADKLYMNPYGEISIKGLGGSVIYYKGLLDKIGIDVQVVKVGTYKSAVEPYILPEMSRPARAQLDTLYGNMWSLIKNTIAKSRKFKNPSEIDSMINIDFIFLKEGDVCLKKGLVDGLFFERSMDSIVGSTVNKEPENINYISASTIAGQEELGIAYGSKNQIAVLFAVGEIIDGGGNAVIDHEKLVPVINNLAQDENVKGMVLRVNSPGGSVYGSEQIGEALDNFQSKGKPLAVSMGDYAASGGYWISSCADRIFADPLTITGSIGIFGLIPDFSPLLNKLGVNPQLVSTNPDAAFPGIMHPLTSRQHEAMQAMVERGYDKFVSRVARGRHLSESRVREIGEGRVWDASKAKEIGLVDEFGGLSDAVEWVASTANIENYEVSQFPIIENSVWSLLSMLDGDSFNKILKKELGSDYTTSIALRLFLLYKQPALQARMPLMKIKFADDLQEITDYIP